MQLLVLQGIPGSGKTTYTREFIKEKTDWVRISRDDLRNMRGDYWIPRQEKLISYMEDTMVLRALLNGFNVLIDATNLNAEVIQKWTGYAKIYGADLEFKMFNITLEEAIKRDNLRPQPVGEKVITDFFYKYISK